MAHINIPPAANALHTVIFRFLPRAAVALLPARICHIRLILATETPCPKIGSAAGQLPAGFKLGSAAARHPRQGGDFGDKAVTG